MAKGISYKKNKTIYFEILSEKQKKIFKKLTFLKKHGFYLAGGTGLALQIGHRTSIDFDFYTQKKFNPLRLKKEFDGKFKKVEVIYFDEDTLELMVDNVRLSFFNYPYKLIKKPLVIYGVEIASLEDIAGMKIIAVTQRGRKRDFVDIYFLIKIFGLKKIFEIVKKKFPGFNIYLGLQGLIYFKDADKEPEERGIKLKEKINWQEIKKFILQELRQFKKEFL